MKDSSYIALIAKNNLTLYGDKKDRLIQEGQDTYWITEMASIDDFDSLESFLSTIDTKTVNWDDGSLRYETTDEVLQLDYNKELTIDSVVQNTHYDIFNSVYAKAQRQDYEIIFSANGQSLILNFSKNIRKATGRYGDIEERF